MLRCLVRVLAAESKLRRYVNHPDSSLRILLPSLDYSTKTAKSAVTKPKKKIKSKDAKTEGAASSVSGDVDGGLEEQRARLLALDDRNPSLDVGPNGRPLFTSALSLSELTRKDTCAFFNFK